MIKINLAQMKQAVAVNATNEAPKKAGESPLNRFKGLSSLNLDSLKSLKSLANPELLQDPKVRRFLIVAVVSLISYIALSSYESSEVQKLEDKVTQVNADNVKLTAEVQKTKGYEAIKKQIDADEIVLKTKLDTIKKLIADRQVPPKLLLALSRDIPAELWLSSCELNEKELKLSGSAVGYTQITDFMKTLGESELLTDVRLVNSKQERDVKTGVDVATFELSAKRK